MTGIHGFKFEISSRTELDTAEKENFIKLRLLRGFSLACEYLQKISNLFIHALTSACQIQLISYVYREKVEVLISL